MPCVCMRACTHMYYAYMICLHTGPTVLNAFCFGLIRNHWFYRCTQYTLNKSIEHFHSETTTLGVKYLITVCHVRNQLSALGYNKNVKKFSYSTMDVENIINFDTDTNRSKFMIRSVCIVSIAETWIWFTAHRYMTENHFIAKLKLLFRYNDRFYDVYYV